MFLYVGMIGWVVGGIGAVLDATVAFNIYLHNTLWVVAHFHTYLMLSVVVWLFALISAAASSHGVFA